jgi:hypothetical protein
MVGLAFKMMLWANLVAVKPVTVSNCYGEGYIKVPEITINYGCLTGKDTSVVINGDTARGIIKLFNLAQQYQWEGELAMSMVYEVNTDGTIADKQKFMKAVDQFLKYRKDHKLPF